jgi:hypothetical protein
MSSIKSKYLTYYKAGVDMKDWYTVAHGDILIACRHLEQGGHPTHPSYLAGLLAACSPRVSVKRSCVWALQLAKDCNDWPHDMPVSVRTHALKFIELGLVTGPKTGPFHRNLLGDPNCVTIDSHMLAAGGFSRSGTVKSMTACQEGVRDVAKHRCTPAEAQAAIWCGWFRESLGREPKYMPLLEVLWNV